MFVLMCVPLTRDRSRNRWHRCDSLAGSRTGVSALGGEWGWERPPSDRTIYSPGIRTYARTCFRGPGSLPARACGAMYPCGKASNPPAAGAGGDRRRLRPPRGPRCRHRQRATAHRGCSRPRSPAPRHRGAGGPAPRRRRPGPPAGRGRRPQRCAAPPRAHRCGGPGAPPPSAWSSDSGARRRGFRGGL